MPGLEPGPRSRDGVVANDQDHPPGMFGSSRLLHTFLKSLPEYSTLYLSHIDIYLFSYLSLVTRGR